MSLSDILLFILVAATAFITIWTVGLPLTRFRTEHITPLITQNCPNALSSIGGSSIEEGLTTVGQLWSCALGLIIYLVLPGAFGIVFLFLKWFFW